MARFVAVATSELEAGWRFHEQGPTNFCALGDQVSTAATLGYLGAVAHSPGDLVTAATLFAVAQSVNRP